MAADPQRAGTAEITETRLFIDGRFTAAASGKTFPTINPATEEVLAEVSEAGAEQGPQVDRAQFDKVLHYIQLGKQEGAECVTGGNRHGDRGYFVQPTLFANVKDHMTIAREEIFGPVLCALRFSDVEEVIARANDTTFGLAAAVWTRDMKKAHLVANRIKAGSIWVNCYYGLDLAAPFGGYKMSGVGRELGEEGILACTELKTVAVNLA